MSKEELSQEEIKQEIKYVQENNPHLPLDVTVVALCQSVAQAQVAKSKRIQAEQTPVCPECSGQGFHFRGNIDSGYFTSKCSTCHPPEPPELREAIEKILRDTHVAVIQPEAAGKPIKGNQHIVAASAYKLANLINPLIQPEIDKAQLEITVMSGVKEAVKLRDIDWIKWLMRRGLMVARIPYPYDSTKDTKAKSLIDEAVKANTERIRDLLDIDSDEEGAYVRISNHVPYSRWQSLSEGKE